MRFLFYDRVTKIEKYQEINAITTFSLSAEFHRGHFRRNPLIPGPLYIEAMAQLLGWLINYSYDFQLIAIMSLIEGVKVPAQTRPGFEALIHAELTSTCSTDSVGRAWIEAKGQKIATMDRALYSHFPHDDPDELATYFRYYSGLTDLGPWGEQVS